MLVEGESIEKPFITPLEVQEIGAVVVLAVVVEQDGWMDGFL